MEESGKKTRNKKKIAGYSLLVCIVLLICIYTGFFTYYQERFFVNSKLNGMDVSKKTVKEVLDSYKKKGDSYQLSIRENGKELLKISGTDIHLKYEVESQIQKMFEKQNPYLWWQAYFKEVKENVEEEISYDVEKVGTLLGGEVFLPESNRAAPKSASIVFDGANFVIQKEEAGTQLVAEQLKELVENKISKLDETDLELTTEACYVQPTYTEQSPEVVQACEKMNGYCKAQITYKFSNGKKETIGKDKISGWVSLGEDWQVAINQEAVKEHLNVLAKTYGSQIYVKKELPKLLADIENGTVTERAPEAVPYQAPTVMDRSIYEPGTYIEVDLTRQHMWFVENEEVKFECNIVTGLPGGRETPAGEFTIIEKKRNKILTGNIVPSTGKPEYRTPVDYWMRLTNRGIGFHDATWQSSFGGNRYKTHGSHGCINMPHSAAATLYNLAPMGTRTIIHY